ncbi:hypothetical protein GOBAR_DD10347 [Gossypium barbadense]|nr:hypothetical protein GOBAR_DD10347 [Gossypium barbadense]
MQRPSWLLDARHFSIIRNFEWNVYCPLLHQYAMSIVTLEFKSALSQCPRETVFAVVGLKEGGDFIEIEKRRDEISLLEEELVQLTLKSSQVVPNENPTLICSFWTQKSYNPDSFRAQLKSIWKPKKKFEIQVAGQSFFFISFECEDDLEMIMEGRPWPFRRVIFFYRLRNPIDRSKLRLVLSPFWLKINPCSPKFDKKGSLTCDWIGFWRRNKVKEVKVEETLRYSFRRRFTIQLTIGLWESFLPNIVTDNLRRDLGDSNMVSSPLIEGISTKLRDSFESIVADVRMDFEIGEGQLGKSGYMEGKSENAKKVRWKRIAWG